MIFILVAALFLGTQAVEGKLVNIHCVAIFTTRRRHRLKLYSTIKLVILWACMLAFNPTCKGILILYQLQLPMLSIIIYKIFNYGYVCIMMLNNNLHSTTVSRNFKGNTTECARNHN